MLLKEILSKDVLHTILHASINYSRNNTDGFVSDVGTTNINNEIVSMEIITFFNIIEKIWSMSVGSFYRNIIMFY